MTGKRLAILPYLAGIAVASIFGFSFLFTKSALDYTQPFQLLGFRFATAAIVLSLLAIFGLIRLNFKKKLKPLFLLTLFQPILYFTFETYGVKWTSASEAAMIIALIPVAATAMAAVFLREKLSFWQIIFLLTSLSGVFLVIVNQGKLEFGSHSWGVLVLLGAVLAAAVYNILSKHLSQEFTPIEITFVMMWVGAIFFNVLGLVESAAAGNLENYLSPLVNIDALMAILYLGILSSIVAFFLLNYMLSKLTVSQAAAFNNLTTVVAVFGGVVFRGETFTWIHATGVILIILGVWGINRGRKRIQ